MVALVTILIFGDRIAENYIRNRFSKSSSGAYQISFDEVDVDLFQGSLRLEGIEIQTDSTKTDSASNAPLRANIDLLALRGLSYWSFLWNDALEADSLLVEGVVLQLQKKDSKAGAAGNWQKRFQGLDFYSKIKPGLSKIEISHIALSEVDLYQQASGAAEDKILAVQGLNAVIQDFVVDSSTYFSRERFMYAQKLHLSADTLQLNLDEKQQRLVLHQLDMGIENNLLSVRLGQIQATNAAGDKGLSISLDSLVVEKLDNYQLMESHAIDINYILALHPQLSGTVPAAEQQNTSSTDTIAAGIASFSLVNLIKPSFNSASIDSILVKDADIQLQEYVVQNATIRIEALNIDSMPAFVNERFLHAKSFNLTTDSSRIALANGRAGWANSQLTYQNGKGNFESAAITIKMPSVDVAVPELQLQDFSMDIGSQSIAVHQVLVQQPTAAAKSGQPSDKGKKAGQLPSSLQQYLQPFISQLTIEIFDVREGKFSMGQSRNQENRLILPLINYRAQNIVIDERPAFEGDRFWHAGSATASLHDVQYYISNSSYAVRLKRMALDSEKKELLMNDFLYRSTAAKAWYVVPDKSAIYAGFDLLLMDNVNWEEAFLEKFFKAGKLSIRGLDLKTFTDRTKKAPETQRPMLQEMLKLPNVDYYFRKLDIANAKITYREAAPKADSNGILLFSKINITADHLTDHPDYIKKYPELTIHGNGRLFDQAPVQTVSIVDMLSPDNKMKLSGEVGSMDARAFNAIALPAAPVFVKSGNLISSSWQFKADAQGAVGEFQLLYNDLKIGVNTGDKEDTTGVFQNALSGIVNSLIIKDDRLPTEEKAKPVEVENERNPNRTFFNYYWATLLTGIKKCVGIPSL